MSALTRWVINISTNTIKRGRKKKKHKQGNFQWTNWNWDISESYDLWCRCLIIEATIFNYVVTQSFLIVYTCMVFFTTGSIWVPEAFELVHGQDTGWSHRTNTHKLCIFVHVSLLCQICFPFTEILKFFWKKKCHPLCNSVFELLALINHEMSLCSVN